MKYAFFRDHVDRFPVELIRDVLEVSRSGYHAWRQRPPSTKAIRRGEGQAGPASLAELTVL